MRAGAQPDVRPALPVPQVVHALEARAGPVRDLVMAVAGVAKHVAGQQEHVGLQIGIGSGHLAGRDLPSERGRRLDRERIRRDVLGAEG